MELIPKQKIEEAAKEYAEPRSSAEVFRHSHIADFTSGVEFSQNELMPFFCEFANFIKDKAIPYRNDRWLIKGKPSEIVTTQQLFELWLNEKQK